MIPPNITNSIVGVQVQESNQAGKIFYFTLKINKYEIKFKVGCNDSTATECELQYPVGINSPKTTAVSIPGENNYILLHLE